MMKLRFTAFNVTLSLVALFIISRAVTCIDTAMPYDGKMKTNVITIDSMRFTGELCDIIQHNDNNSYFFKSYGQFKVRDLDSLQGRSVVLTYLGLDGGFFRGIGFVNLKSTRSVCLITSCIGAPST
jgi:hypothetical protein